MAKFGLKDSKRVQKIIAQQLKCSKGNLVQILWVHLIVTARCIGLGLKARLCQNKVT